MDAFDKIKTIKDIPTEDLVTGGHGLCPGCGAAIGMRLTLKALGKNTVVVNSSGCLTLQVLYPRTPFKVPWIHNAIENASATASGIFRALRKQKKEANIVVYAGDGATYDIGFQSLSGAAERGENIIYVCYNNQAFMNTGIQWSSASPYGAWTTTTPSGRKLHIGNFRTRKHMAQIMAAHGLDYVATACVAYPIDYINKLRKARDFKGFKYIDLLTPCQPGWNYDPKDTVEVAKRAVDSGMWPLYEIEKGTFRLTHTQKSIPVSHYFELQKRYKHLKPSQVEEIQILVNKEWEKLKNGDAWWVHGKHLVE